MKKYGDPIVARVNEFTQLEFEFGEIDALVVKYGEKLAAIPKESHIT